VKFGLLKNLSALGPFKPPLKMRQLFVSWLTIQLWVVATFGIKNPIISGWNPDPSILRVGDEYFLATSSFEYWPSTPIYKSKDLANWELYSHALTRADQAQLYGTPTGAGAYVSGL
jgi:beta-xylosidase